MVSTGHSVCVHRTCRVRSGRTKKSKRERKSTKRRGILSSSSCCEGRLSIVTDWGGGSLRGAEGTPAPVNRRSVEMLCIASSMHDGNEGVNGGPWFFRLLELCLLIYERRVPGANSSDKYTESILTVRGECARTHPSQLEVPAPSTYLIELWVI